jgi:hypothetical protein
MFPMKRLRRSEHLKMLSRIFRIIAFLIELGYQGFLRGDAIKSIDDIPLGTL